MPLRPSRVFPRFATVCVKGRPLKQARHNPGRLMLLAHVIQAIDQRCDHLDAVVFPGGYLRLGQTVGPLSFADRVQALKKAGVVKPLTHAARALSRSSGVQIVLGIDGSNHTDRDGKNHLCVAVNETGITGMGRKVFPVGDEEADYLLCYDADFRDPHRVIRLASGRRAALAACFDMFGIAERGDVRGRRARNIQWLGDHNDPVERGEKGFRERLQANLAALTELLAKENVTVGISAIHDFRGHRTGFWQRHGIAACSAALNNGFAVGAAHFWHQLPQRPGASTLAAAHVPAKHLTQGLRRRSHSWIPSDHFSVDCDYGTALVRIFG